MIRLSSGKVVNGRRGWKTHTGFYTDEEVTVVKKFYVIDVLDSGKVICIETYAKDHDELMIDFEFEENGIDLINEVDETRRMIFLCQE